MKLVTLIILSQMKNFIKFLDLYKDPGVKNMKKSKLFEFQFINFCSTFVLTASNIEELDKEIRDFVLFHYFSRLGELRRIAEDLVKILRQKNGELPPEVEGFLDCLDILERTNAEVKSDLLKMDSDKGM